jgi:hypothetical protein
VGREGTFGDITGYIKCHSCPIPTVTDVFDIVVAPKTQKDDVIVIVNPPVPCLPLQPNNAVLDLCDLYTWPLKFEPAGLVIVFVTSF